MANEIGWTTDSDVFFYRDKFFELIAYVQKRFGMFAFCLAAASVR